MKKSLVNPVIHEIRSANPQKPRFSAESTINSSNKYQNSIDGMAGVGYNRDSNKLRQLQQDASTIATGARPNPEKNEKRFMGLFGNDVFNEPQKTMSSEDLQMRQNSEMLRHGNTNRRFGKSNSVKKSSYENGIAGAGYSGEIVVTPKKGRPYKGQPNSLPLVSKRGKLNKTEGDLLDSSNPKSGWDWETLAIMAATLIGSPLGVSQIAQMIASGPGKAALEGGAKGGIKGAIKGTLQALPYTDAYSIYSLLENARDAEIKEYAYNNRGNFPAVDYYPKFGNTSGYVKNYDTFGEAALNPYGMIPHDWDLWGAGKYISPFVRSSVIGSGKVTVPKKFKNKFEENAWRIQQEHFPNQTINPIMNFSDLPLHRQFEEQMWGRPVETRRTPNLDEIIRQAIIQPSTGQMIFPKGKDVNAWDLDPRGELLNVFGDVGSNYGMAQGVLSDIEGWTKNGERRKTNIYREQPFNFFEDNSRQSLKPYSTNPYADFTQTSNDPRLLHGYANWYEESMPSYEKTPFYSEKTVNDYSFNPEGGYKNDMTSGREWMTGARLTHHGPYADVNQTAIWTPEKTHPEKLWDWYNSTFNNNSTWNNNQTQSNPTSTPTSVQPANPTPTSKWKSLPTPTSTPVTKSLTANKRKFEETKKSLNFTKSLSSKQNKYDTTLKNQIPSRNKYLK